MKKNVVIGTGQRQSRRIHIDELYNSRTHPLNITGEYISYLNMTGNEGILDIIFDFNRDGIPLYRYNLLLNDYNSFINNQDTSNYIPTTSIIVDENLIEIERENMRQQELERLRQQIEAENILRNELGSDYVSDDSDFLNEINDFLQNANSDFENFEGKGLSKKIVKNVKKPISGILQDVKQTGKLLIKGSNDYPPNVKKIMTQYGNEIIKSMTLKRTPVSGLLTGALNVFSLGKFGKRMSKSFDELFHLFLEIQLQSGTRLLLEKNERINMEINPKERPDTQIKNIINVPPNLSVNQLLETTKRQMGSQFFQYDAVKNNCQDFLLNVLKLNGIGDEQDYAFIKQDTEQLFKGLPALKKVAHLATELGERGNILLQGGALDNQLFSHTKNPSKVIEIIRMLRKLKK